MTTTTSRVYEIGEAPPLGVVPERMHAQVIRQARYGEPLQAFTHEVVPLPRIGPDEVLVYVMAAGVNYNNVWAALGIPVDIVRTHKQAGDAGDETGFHIGGSDGAGIVSAVGENVTDVKVGDEVVLHCGIWDERDPFIQAGGDPALSNGFRIWGYDSNWGSFAQFTRVKALQCLPKPPSLSWEQAAAYTLDAATAYRMLASWPPHTVREGDVVLVWGGSGGLGAKGYIDRTQFDHWGRLPDWTDEEATTTRVRGYRAFGKAIWDVLGERRSPRIVFEHPGQDTLPTSVFVSDTGGMVVICAGTSGYNGDVDLRYLWTRQKRLQGSHFANRQEAEAVSRLVAEE